MDKIEKSGKTIEDALEAALQELGLKREQVEYRVLEAPTKSLFGLLGGRDAKIEVTVKRNSRIDNARDFILNVTKVMGLQVSLDEPEIVDEENVVLCLRGDDLGVLIGKHGQTLDALQYLTNLATQKEFRDRIRIVLDVEDYRKRRAETLELLARRIASRVAKTGERVVLEPMTPHERKIIHMSLQNDEKIETYSEGEEPYRRVVIVNKG